MKNGGMVVRCAVCAAVLCCDAVAGRASCLAVVEWENMRNKREGKKENLVLHCFSFLIFSNFPNL